MDFFDILLAQDANSSRREAQAQNGARLAMFRHTHASTGVGTVRIEQPVMFDVAFLERPHFSQGAAVRVGPNIGIWNMPVGTAGLYQWERNVKGHYIGAYIYLDTRMHTRNGDVIAYPHVEMLYDLTFSGIAYKDFGDAMTTEAHVVRARRVEYGQPTDADHARMVAEYQAALAQFQAQTNPGVN